MRATTIRVVVVGAWILESDEGYSAPSGWRIVDSERVSGNRYRVTLANV